MRVLLVHPSALMYSQIFLRLEPLGLERVAAALLTDGHDVRLIDLQVYRKADLEDMARIAEPGVFIVDDVAFIKAEDGDQIAALLKRRGIRKQYYLETRCDVLLRNTEVFRRWRRLGLNYMFLAWKPWMKTACGPSASAPRRR